MRDLLTELDRIVDTTLAGFTPRDAIFVAVGVLLLIFGRRLYWLALAGLGFVAAVHLSREYLHFDSGQQQLVVGLAVGLLGGLLAVLAQKLAIRIAGFVLGGWGAWIAAGLLWPDAQLLLTVPTAAAGALLGLLLAARLFDMALVLVTSVIGAVLIAQHLHLQPQVQAVVWLALTLAGIAMQVSRGRRRPGRASKDEGD